MHRESKGSLIILLSALFLAIVLFYLIDLFTLNYRGKDYGTSGNGNPGLLFVFPAVPVYLFMLVFIYKLSGSYYRRKHISLLWPAIIALLLLILCYYGEYQLAQSLIQQLGGGPHNPDSVIYRWSWLNQYTNTLFFNGFTFTIGVLLAVLISSCQELVRRRK